ncbi:MAG: hypothetical protein L6Q83_11500, partial [Gammaproteobacteria bacterium]|nr:hypothetical protein [Gammaproteobacteria bacterium]
SACARLRLLIEGRLADLLLTGDAIPQPRPPSAWRKDPALRDSTLYEMHINLPHIQAVARHQRRHLRKTADSPPGQT